MFIEEIKKLFTRDLDRLANEIEAYANEEQLWIKEQLIANSAGSLCLHLCGNLNHFIGHIMSGTDYQRDRDFEFSGQPVKRNVMLEEIQKTGTMIAECLGNMDPEVLGTDLPIIILNQQFSYQSFLIHLYGHFNYHLGQINYHRRILAV